MASPKPNRIADIVNQFVADITEAIQQESNEKVQEELKKFAQGFGAKAMPRKTTKGRKMIKPCPVEGCKNNAAPRWRMVCREHCEKLTKDEIAAVRYKANQPGGIWYRLKEKAKKTG